jgi:hypothetical protein
MGSWGVGVFENDAALDCVANIVDGGGLPAVEAMLGQVRDAGSEYLEAPQAQCALAAAEIVAGLAGRPASNGKAPPDLAEWMAHEATTPAPDVIALARLAAARVASEPSELLELWQETADFPAWKATVDDLLAHL